MEAYLEGFDNINDVFEKFNYEPENEILLFGIYEYGNYEGSAWVGFLKDEKLYEVHGSHCSCYGLEGQWDPEETSLEEILYRINNGGQDSFKDSHKRILQSLSSLILTKELDESLPVNEVNERTRMKI
jgi:hypothetical protein